MDILGGLDEKYVALAMPRSCGHSTTDDTHTATAIESVELDGKITTKDRILYWVTHSLGVAAAAFLIIGAAVLLIMNWDKIAVSGNDRPGVITTVSEPVVTSDSTITEPDKYDPFLYYSDMDMPEPFAQPEITEFYYGGTDGWHDEFYNLWKNDFYMIDDYLQKYVGEERAMEVISGYKAEQLADNQAGNITRYRIDDTQNWYRFAMDTGLTANDVRRARQMADENWSESPASMVQEDIFVTFGSKEKIAENNKTEYCISVGEYVFSPRWLYYHTTEDYKAAGITPRMINDMLEKYKTLGLTDEAWAAFSAKLQEYADTADPFGQITDTSMPRPFPEWHDTDNAQFEFQWKTKAVGAAMDCRGRENYDEWDRRCMSIRTPYRLDDNNNVAGGIKWFGITSKEIDEYFEKRNARWQESLEQAEERGNEGAIINCRNEIFSEEEINALKSGNDAEIIALFISDYSIWLTGSNYVISPEWLYYHTAEDYAAIGIEPQMIAAKIPLFEKTFTGTDNGEDLDEKSWELFKAKLTAYAESMIAVTKPEKKINLSVDTLLDLDAVTADYTYKMIEDYESDENWQNMKEWVEKTYVGENAAELLELFRSTDYFGYPDYDVQYAGNDVCDSVIRKMFGFTSFVQYNSWEMFIFVKDGKAVGATDIMKRSGLGWIVDGNDLYEVATTENILHIDLLTLEYDWIPIKEGYATIADINDDWLIYGNGPLHTYNRHTGEIITPDTGEWNGLYSSLMRLNGDRIEYTKEPGNGYWYDLRTGESGEDPDIYNTPILMVFENDKYRIHSYYNTVAEACPEEFDFSRISVTRKSDGLTKVFSFETLLDGRSGETDGKLLNNLILGDWFITKLSGCGRIAVNCDTGESANVSDTFGNYRIWSLTSGDGRCFVEFANDTRTAHLFGLLLCYDSAS